MNSFFKLTLTTQNKQQSIEYYDEVFQWEYRKISENNGLLYTSFGQAIAELIEKPQQHKNQWSVEIQPAKSTIPIEDNRHLHGSGGWAELFTTNLSSSIEFYENKYSWTFKHKDIDEDQYAQAYANNKAIAGFREHKTINQWLPYITVDCFESFLKTHKKHKGHIIVAPKMLSQYGVYGIFEDKFHGQFGVCTCES